MRSSKEELVKEIETARLALNESIGAKHPYGEIYEKSAELDRLIERYIASGY